MQAQRFLLLAALTGASLPLVRCVSALALEPGTPTPIGRILSVSKDLSREKGSVRAHKFTWGGFVVTWDEFSWAVGPDYGSKLFARRFGRDGLPLGAGRLVNNGPRQPDDWGIFHSSAVLPSDGYVVVWQAFKAEGNFRYGIHVRVFGSSGRPETQTILLSKPDDWDHYSPMVASFKDGSFLVVWEVLDEIKGQVVDSDGTPKADVFTVREKVGGSYPKPHEALALQSGGILVTWITQRGLSGQIIEPSGSKSGNEFEIVSSLFDGFTGGGKVAELESGEFIAVWTGSAFVNSQWQRSIRSQRFDHAWNRMGKAVKIVKTNEPVRGYDVHIVPLPQSEYLVAWSDKSQYEETNRVRGARFTSAGTLLGSSFSVWPGSAFAYPMSLVGYGSNQMAVVARQFWDVNSTMPYRIVYRRFELPSVVTSH